MRGCICHFAEWQIQLYISKGTNVSDQKCLIRLSDTSKMSLFVLKYLKLLPITTKDLCTWPSHHGYTPHIVTWNSTAAGLKNMVGTGMFVEQASRSQACKEDGDNLVLFGAKLLGIVMLSLLLRWWCTVMFSDARWYRYTCRPIDARPAP